MDLFYQVLDMSKIGSYVILGVILLRFFLRKAPKVFSYALWTLVLARLLCPISIEAPVSILPETESVRQAVVSYSAPDKVADEQWPGPENGEVVARETSAAAEGPSVVTVAYALDGESWAFMVWLAGMGAMALYSLLSYWRLKSRLITAVPQGKRVYTADHIPSPFVLGFLSPRIYLPSGLTEREQAYILLHERHHVRRGDHIWKALGFLALTIHWFNPLAWLAFVLAGKDMEMSCDEAVVKRLGEDIRADYSQSLLSFAAGQPFPAGTPLAFGEGNPKERIKNLLNWKKPKFWVIVLSAIACAVLAVCLLTDPVPDTDYIRMTDTDMSQSVQFELRQETLCGGVITVEHWVKGVCDTTTFAMFDGKANSVKLTMAPQTYGEAAGTARVQIDIGGEREGNGSYHNSTSGDFSIAENGTIVGWGLSTFRENEKIHGEPGSTHILAAWFLDSGTDKPTDVLGRSLIEQEPERLREIESAIVVKVSFFDNEAQDFLLMDGYMSDGMGRSLIYVPRLGNQVRNCRIYPELWTDTSVTAYPYLQISDQDPNFEISLSKGSGEEMNYRISANSGEIRGVLPWPSESSGGAVYTHPESGASIGGIPGESRIIAVIQFSKSGEPVKALDCEVWEQEPWRLKNEDYILLFRADFLLAEETPKPEKKILTLDELTALSQKGEDLTWADFEDYVYTDVGFGNIVRAYETDDTSFRFTIGGPSLGEQPQTMFLNHIRDASIDDDIRFINVAEYIRRYREALPEGLIQEEYPMDKLFLPLESYDRSPRISYYVPLDQEAWLEEFQKVHAASQKGGWSAGEFYAGLQVVYDGSYYMLSDQGGFILHKDGDVRTADPADSANLREMMLRAANDFYGGRRFSQEALAEETLVKATLSDGNKTITDPEALKKLQTILTEAQPQRGATACDFSLRLTLETEEGVCTNVYIAIDACGLYTADGLYFQYNRSVAEDELLELFSMSPDA